MLSRKIRCAFIISLEAVAEKRLGKLRVEDTSLSIITPHAVEDATQPPYFNRFFFFFNPISLRNLRSLGFASREDREINRKPWGRWRGFSVRRRTRSLLRRSKMPPIGYDFFSNLLRRAPFCWICWVFVEFWSELGDFCPLLCYIQWDFCESVNFFE